MEEIIELTKKAEKMYNNEYASITIYSDGAGSIWIDCHQTKVYEFVTLKELRNHLNG